MNQIKFSLYNKYLKNFSENLKENLSKNQTLESSIVQKSI